MTRRNDRSRHSRSLRGIRALVVVAATMLSLGQIAACVPGAYYVSGYRRPAYYRYGYGYDPYYPQPYPYYRGYGYGGYGGVVVAPPGVVVAPPGPVVVPPRPGVIVAPGGGRGPRVVVPR